LNISLSRKCPRCGGDIINRSWKAKYCCEECKWKFNNKKRSINDKIKRNKENKK